MHMPAFNIVKQLQSLIGQGFESVVETRHHTSQTQHINLQTLHCKGYWDWLLRLKQNQ